MWPVLTSYFNPRSHCRERRTITANCIYLIVISIHVPIAGNDGKTMKIIYEPSKFQSTFPLQGTTLSGIKALDVVQAFQSTFPLQGTTLHLSKRPISLVYISIHVPIAGNDGWFAELDFYCSYFNPRSHCRERPILWQSASKNFIFQSTFPLQGTTFRQTRTHLPLLFQSTFPLQGTTDQTSLLLSIYSLFQSTFPLQGTTANLSNF